jgi:antirestriction protein
MTSLYFADLADYNAGRLVGQWFDLGDYDSPEELLADVQQMLRSRSEITGELHEEWAVHDHDLPLDIGEFPDFDEVFALKDAVEQHGESIVNAAITAGVPLSEIDDRFVGFFDSPGEWAADYLRDTGALYELPNYLRNYFDYDGFAQDCAYNGDMSFIEIGYRHVAAFSLA